mgnify:CR=1 FL=1
MITLESVRGEFLNQYSLSSKATKEKYRKDIDLFCSVTEIESLQELNDLNNIQVERLGVGIATQ